MSIIGVIFALVVFIMIGAVLASVFLFFSYSFLFVFAIAVLVYLLVLVVKKGLMFVYPAIEFLGKLLRLNVDTIKRSAIDHNNKVMLKKIVQNQIEDPSRVLIVLPHCIQNSACLYKVTWDKLDNCRSCGKCCVPEFVSLKKKYGVEVVIVSGGSAAREIIKEKKPKAIIAVACENDLVSGLRDVQGIPVFAVLNQRPKGPCRDTTVDVATVKSYILKLIK